MATFEIENIIDTYALADHSFEPDEGVYKIIRKSKIKGLNQFLEAFNSYLTEHDTLALPISQYAELPFGPAGNQAMWKMRQYDIKLINKVLNTSQSKRILDIGAWNGWLSNRLSDRGHEVVAMDYFLHERYGLKAKKFYPNDWLSLQMDLCDFHLFSCKFDLIVINRCLPYFPDPAAKLGQLISLLAKNGKIVITGLSLLKNDQKHLLRSEQQRREFKERFGMDLFYNDVRGFLNTGDRKWIESAGFTINKYKEHWLGNLKAGIIATSPLYCFAVYE